jgi:hypothetical protein
MTINTQSYGNTQAHSEADQRDNGSVTNRQDSHISLMEVRKYLEGAKFPSNKNDLVKHAKQQQAPDHIVNVLQQLPTPEFGSGNATKMTEYNNLDELLHEIERIE